MSTPARNIVLIMDDQLRADHLGVEGSYPVSTPTLDALAARGARFTRTFVANPVCMPNRATILTGQWPSVHGLRTNGLPLDWSAETFPRVLRARGWRTSAVGKLHLQPMGYPFEDYQLDEIQDVMPELWEHAVEQFGSPFRSWEDYQRHAEGDVQLPPDYYGFDDVSLTVGHGDRLSGNYVSWARERGWDPQTMAGVAQSPDVFTPWDHVYESAVPAALHPTTYVTDQAIERIDAVAATGQSLMLHVSFPDPHHPFAPPREYFYRHRPEDMPLAPGFHETHERSPEYIRGLIARRGTPEPDPMMLWSPTEEQYRAALAAELGGIEFIDDSIGRLVDALERNGLLDDTLIVFTADHGDAFGEHGLMLKHFSHYRPIVRVPLLMAGPGIEAAVHDQLVSSADIAPTVLALVDAPALPRAQGRSLKPLVQGQPLTARQRLLIEEDQPFGMDGLPGPVRMRTLVTDQFRLTEIPGHGITELYDLRTDPGESMNLAADPAAVKLLAEARREMLDALVELVDSSTLPFHAA